LTANEHGLNIAIVVYLGNPGLEVSSMKAAILKEAGVISIEEVETPRPGPGEVVVKVSYCGICGSDLRSFASGIAVGAIMGHEPSGVIAEIGEGVSDWSVGQRVTPIPFRSCWHCYECTHGRPHMCRNTVVIGDLRLPGAYAEYMKVKASQLYATPEEITDQEAALNEPLAVSLHAVLLSGMTVGNSVAIIGAGPIGLMAIQCAKLAGAKGIYVAQRSEPRASMAGQVGADMVINPEEKDFRREVRRETGIGADVCLECVGSGEAFQLALRVVRACGRVVLVGGSGPTEIITGELLRRELEIKGSLGYWTEFPDGLELLRLHKIKTEGMVTRVVPLSEIQETFTGLLQVRNDIKVLVAP